MHHPYETKVKAALAYVLYGSIGQAAKAVGIPKTSVANWLHTPEWNALVRSIRVEHEAELDANLSCILREALELLLDRVERGNPIVDKTGKVVRYQPLSAMEALAILNTVSKMKDRLSYVEEVERGATRLDRVVEILRARGRLNEEDRLLLAPQSGTAQTQRTAGDGDSMENRVREGTEGVLE